MLLSEMQEKYLTPLPKDVYRILPESRKALCRCVWKENPANHNSTVVLSTTADDRGNRVLAIILVDASGMYYTVRNDDSRPIEGPYEFDQLLTLAALEGYTIIY